MNVLRRVIPRLVCILALVAASTELAAQDSFKLAVLPDTQVYADLYPATFVAQTQWLADNAAAMDIVFTTHVGDVVESPTSDRMWDNANAAMDILNAANLNYAVVPGNHDVSSNLASPQLYLTHYGPSRFEDMPTWRSHSPNGYSQYHIFTADGREYLSLSLDINAPDNELAWAQSVLDMHPRVPTILTTHILIDTNGALYPSVGWVRIGYGNSPRQIWDKFITKNPQIFLTINGHFHGAAYSKAFNDAGLAVHRILVDYQGAPDGGGGFLRWIEFDFDNNLLINRTYSPVSDSFRDDFEYDDFVIPIDFERRFALQTEFVEQGTLLGAEIEGVSSEETRFGGRLAAQTVNGSGITGYNGQTVVNASSLHNPLDAANTMWSSVRNAIDDQWIAFDLGRPVNIQGLAIWQFGENATSGVQSFDLYAGNGTTYSEGALTFVGRFTLDAWISGDIPAQILPFADHIEARYFKLEIVSNHGDTRFVGLSEVRFIAGPPPMDPLVLPMVTIHREDDDIVLTIHADPGVRYQVLRNGSLNPGTWTSFGAPFEGTASPVEVTIPMDVSHQFFSISAAEEP